MVEIGKEDGHPFLLLNINIADNLKQAPAATYPHDWG